MISEISIVTGTRNRPESFSRFVTSALRAATVPTELIVADASDVPGSYTRPLNWCDRGILTIHSCDFSFEVIREKERLGTATGYTAAFRKATGRYVVWFNDDCELISGWDRIAIDYMDAHREIGIGAIYFKDYVDGKYEQPHFSVQTFHGMHYANFGVVRRHVGELVNWFCVSSCRHYGVDNAICLATLEAGHAVAPIPGCKCIHWREQDRERQTNYSENQKLNPGDQLYQRFALSKGKPDFSHLKRIYDEFSYLKQPDWIE